MRLKFRLVGSITAAVVLAALAAVAWQRLRPPALPAGFASGNGRMEAVTTDIATRAAGRVAAILVREGDFVDAGQVLARMDTGVVKAQRLEAQAQVRRARLAVQTAEYQVGQREAELKAAQAYVQQRQVERHADATRLTRMRRLARSNAVSAQQLDDAQARYQGARKAVDAALAQQSAAGAALETARSEVIGARAAVAAAEAVVQRIQVDIDDAALRAPVPGRIQYRIAQPGEVLGSGAPVLRMVDLSDVYMTFFLPTAEAGRVAMGAPVHLVLDAAPEYVIPARVTFVADVAQFTPKTVETAKERAKLMFRIRARVDPSLLKRYLRQVKTGLPGMAYVRLDSKAQWPPRLRVRLPEHD